MTQDQPDRLDRLEAALARFAELTIQNTVRHDEVLTRLEDSASRHDEALTRIEEQTSRNSVAIDRLTSRVDALTTTTTETLRLVADNSIEIRRIWDYLLRQSGNGRGEV